jgi:hypothetical protein
LVAIRLREHLGGSLIQAHRLQHPPHFYDGALQHRPSEAETSDLVLDSIVLMLQRDETQLESGYIHRSTSSTAGISPIHHRRLPRLFL